MTIVPLLEAALEARAGLFDARHEAALRLFNGFTEGCPELVADLYGGTLLLHNYAEPPEDGEALARAAAAFYRARLPWLRAAVLKARQAEAPEERQGVVLWGEQPDRKVREHGVWYAIDLLMNRDASLYLDTRNLRAWALANLRGKRVLNTFAYTGSLGVAAQAGGAARVVHVDINRRFLNVAKTSYTLNGFPIDKHSFLTWEFFAQVNQLKRAGERFDCVLLDPPFFATTPKGTIDLLNNSTQLINKVRPLVDDGGYVVAVNNALFLSGARYLAALEELCASGHVSVEALIPVPDDCIGYPQTRVAGPVVDPAPFNHSTKIAVLRVRHTRPEEE
jgi:23S rRNA (cytosine1962-C5)-methyltransferase